jgi:hypothetical protein
MTPTPSLPEIVAQKPLQHFAALPNFTFLGYTYTERIDQPAAPTIPHIT